MQIRSYRPEDLDALYALDRACFAPPFRFSRAMMRRAAEAHTAIVQLAVEGDTGSLLGFVIVHLEILAGGLSGYVVTLDVSPLARRQGLGCKLLACGEREAARAGAGDMLLHVHTVNQGACALYRSMGYERSQWVRHFYGRGLHAFIYRKALPSADAEAPNCASAAPTGSGSRGKEAS